MNCTILQDNKGMNENLREIIECAHFEEIPEVDVPEGTPVVGYKLFHRTNTGALKQIYGAYPSVRGNTAASKQNDYSLDTPNVDYKNGLGFYYWEDLDIAKAYAKWQIRDANSHDEYQSYEPPSYWEKVLGTYEIRKVTGISLKKRDNPFDTQNEGSVMTEMMIDEVVLARFSWDGKEIPVDSVHVPTIKDKQKSDDYVTID